MSGWGQATQCDAIDPTGARCVLQAGHLDRHRAAAASPRPKGMAVGLVGLTVLIAAEILDIFLSIVAYYGMGGARETPGVAFNLMLLGWVILPVGVILSAMQRRRAALACAAVVLLQVPVGLLALSSSGPSGDVVADGIVVLAFAIPGLLLLGYIWVTPRLVGHGQRAGTTRA